MSEHVNDLTASEAIKEVSFGVQVRNTREHLTSILDKYYQSANSVRQSALDGDVLTQAEVDQHALVKSSAVAAESVLNVLNHGGTTQHVTRKVYDVYLGFRLDEETFDAVATAVAYDAHMRLQIT